MGRQTRPVRLARGTIPRSRNRVASQRVALKDCLLGKEHSNSNPQPVKTDGVRQAINGMWGATADARVAQRTTALNAGNRGRGILRRALGIP